MKNISSTTKPTVNKKSFYESVKMKNYRESARLEGLSVSIREMPMDKQSLAIAKRNLIAKYSKYKDAYH